MQVPPKPLARVVRDFCGEPFISLDKRHGNAIGTIILTSVAFVGSFTEYLEVALLLLGKHIGHQALIGIREVVVVGERKALLLIMRCVLEKQ